MGTRQGKWGASSPRSAGLTGTPSSPCALAPRALRSPVHCTYRTWDTGLGSQPGEWSLEVERRLEGRPLPARPPAALLTSHPERVWVKAVRSMESLALPAVQRLCPPRPASRRPPSPPRPSVPRLALSQPPWAGLPRSPERQRLCLGLGLSSTHSTQSEFTWSKGQLCGCLGDSC